MSPFKLLPTSPSPLAGAGAEQTIANIFVYFLKKPAITHPSLPAQQFTPQAKEEGS